MLLTLGSFDQPEMSRDKRVLYEVVISKVYLIVSNKFAIVLTVFEDILNKASSRRKEQHWPEFL